MPELGNLDSEALFEKVGGLGRYQVLVAVVLTYLGLPNGAGGYLMIYTQPSDLEYRCLTEKDLTLGLSEYKFEGVEKLIPSTVSEDPCFGETLKPALDLELDTCNEYVNELNESSLENPTQACSKGYFWGSSPSFGYRRTVIEDLQAQLTTF